MKVVKVLGAIVLGLLSLVMLLYVIGIAVNWRDQPPSVAALEMKKIFADRAPVADGNNGFVYVMGFAVPASEDPQAAGVARVAWIEVANRDPKQIHADPVKEELDFPASSSNAMQRLRESCMDAHDVKCRDSFVAALPQPRMALQELQLARYRAMLQRRAWREVVPFDIRAPMARYGDIIEGQRLLLVDLAARAKAAPPGEVGALLRDDFLFWREALKSSDYLISRMIAVAAIRQNFFFGSLVLREMPVGQAQVIDAWSVPFNTAELSMRRSMAGELVFAEGTMLQWLDGRDADDVSPWARIGWWLARPYYQHQDQMNFYSARYLDFAKGFEVPLSRYPEVADALEATGPNALSFHVYNPVGKVLRDLGGTWNFASYAMRVGSVEGMRRAATLTAQLRERHVPLDAMSGEVRGTELRDPFSGEAFEWDAVNQAVVYTGPDAEGSRYLHPYFY
jgi:hypothetical protein